MVGGWKSGRSHRRQPGYHVRYGAGRMYPTRIPRVYPISALCSVAAEAQAAIESPTVHSAYAATLVSSRVSWQSQVYDASALPGSSGTLGGAYPSNVILCCVSACTVHGCRKR